MLELMYHPWPVFSHRQLDVAISRVTHGGLKMIIYNEDGDNSKYHFK